MTPEVSAVDGSPMATPAPGLTVSLHGPAVTIEDMIEAGRATKQLLKAAILVTCQSMFDAPISRATSRSNGIRANLRATGHRATSPCPILSRITPPIHLISVVAS